MSKIKLPANELGETGVEKSLEIVAKESPSYKTSEAQRRAIRKYESTHKRINCRIPPDLWQKIVQTGESANSIILKALERYFS